MTQAYVYIRYSTTEQEDGDSYERQHDGGLELIRKRGWTLAEKVEDLGRSAYKGEHMLATGALGQFTEKVKAGDIPPGSWLIAEKTDRLSREGWEVLFDWLRDVTRKGLNIETLDGHVFTAETLKDQVSVIKILMGGEEDRKFSAKISERVQLAYVRGVERGTTKEGKKLSSRCPGWLVLNEDKTEFLPIPDRVEVVRKVFDLAAEGRGSRWIAKHLNEQSIPTWGTRQKAVDGWDASTIQWLLKSPAVEGDYVTGYSNPSRVKNAGLTISGYFPAVVDADLVSRARTSMKDRKWSGGASTPSAANLFRGLVKCGSCGARMYLNHNMSTGRVFQCSAAMSKRSCDQREVFRYEAFEKSALDTILDLALDDRWFSKADDTYAHVVALAEAKKRVSEHEARLNRAVEMMLDGEVGDVFAARVPELKLAVQVAKAAETAAQEALDRARGQVSPAEHQRRVMSVRNAIEAEDATVRIDARLRVTQALAGIVERIECHIHEEWGRTFWMTLKLNLLRIVIDQEGVVWEQSMSAPKTDGGPANEKLLADVIRRDSVADLEI